MSASTLLDAFTNLDKLTEKQQVKVVRFYSEFKEVQQRARAAHEAMTEALIAPPIYLLCSPGLKEWHDRRERLVQQREDTWKEYEKLISKYHATPDIECMCVVCLAKYLGFDGKRRIPCMHAPPKPKAAAPQPEGRTSSRLAAKPRRNYEELNLKKMEDLEYAIDDRRRFVLEKMPSYKEVEAPKQAEEAPKVAEEASKAAEEIAKELEKAYDEAAKYAQLATKYAKEAAEAAAEAANAAEEAAKAAEEV